jgi:transcription antitermination factor NusG
MNELPREHWAVCRTFSNRVRWVRPEIEKTNHGTFMPTYVRVWASDGKLSCRERALMPGYLFFFLPDPDRWSEVKNVEGVFDVISNNGRASKVTEQEINRLVLGHIRGEYNDINLDGLERTRGPRRQRQRRPRASKRARAAA